MPSAPAWLDTLDSRPTADWSATPAPIAPRCTVASTTSAWTRVLENVAWMQCARQSNIGPNANASRDTLEMPMFSVIPFPCPGYRNQFAILVDPRLVVPTPSAPMWMARRSAAVCRSSKEPRQTVGPSASATMNAPITWPAWIKSAPIPVLEAAARVHSARSAFTYPTVSVPWEWLVIHSEFACPSHVVRSPE